MQVISHHGVPIIASLASTYKAHSYQRLVVRGRTQTQILSTVILMHAAIGKECASVLQQITHNIFSVESEGCDR